jgi:protein arginine kinase activator
MPDDDHNMFDGPFDEPEPEFDPDEEETVGPDEGEGDEPDVPCEECHKERATVHITDLEGDEPVLRHLCRECARNQKDFPEIDQTEVFAQLLSNIIPELKELSNRICPACKISYLTFRHTGRLGCPQCYEAFDAALQSVLQGVHGATQHVGKVSVGADVGSTLENRIRALENLLQDAVSREEYERAARIRDEIRDLKTELDDAS